MNSSTRMCVVAIVAHLRSPDVQWCGRVELAAHCSLGVASREPARICASVRGAQFAGLERVVCHESGQLQCARVDACRLGCAAHLTRAEQPHPLALAEWHLSSEH